MGARADSNTDDDRAVRLSLGFWPCLYECGSRFAHKVQLTAATRAFTAVLVVVVESGVQIRTQCVQWARNSKWPEIYFENGQN